jgi:hypothetical protein
LLILYILRLQYSLCFCSTKNPLSGYISLLISILSYISFILFF